MNLREYARAVAEAVRDKMYGFIPAAFRPWIPPEMIDAIIASVPAPTGTGCAWKCDEDGVWWTTCGQGFSFFDDGPPEHGFVFCCYCGEKLTTSLVPPTTEETISDEERAAYARGRADARRMYEQRWEEPVAQHHDAPTCDGWWWAHRAEADCWWLVHFEAEDDRVEPAQGFAAYEAADFDRWVGPLRSPDDAD